jgi:hypothetical protein
MGTNVSENHTSSKFGTEDVMTHMIAMDIFTVVRTSDLIPVVTVL